MPAPKRRRLTAILLLVLVLAPGLARGSGDPANDPRVRAVARRLVCYCGCSTQSIADCTCGVAQKERAGILADLEGGMEADQVVAAWVERYGTRILIEPPLRGFNLLGWLLPGVLLTLAAVGLTVLLWRWSRRPPAAAGPAPTLDPDDLARLERELRSLEP